MPAPHRLHVVLAKSYVCVHELSHSCLTGVSYLLCYRNKEPLQDNVIATYEEHEDSVYAVDWASADPWLFASLSYDGRLVINRVPRALKYHILL